MVSPFLPGVLVAGYLRDSGGDTQELSVVQQRTAIERYCQEHGLVLGQVFIDAARPGSSTVGRDAFLAMMDYFRHSAVEAGLIIWSYSRFARDFDDAAFYRADLRRRGYILHSLVDQIPDGNIGRLFEAIIDWKNEQFLEDLSRDVKRGLYELVTKYGAVPGTPPRGFRRERLVIGRRRDGSEHVVHRWVVDEGQVGLVRRAWEMRAAGRPLAEIQAETGLYRSLNSWATFFDNRLYVGVLEFGDLVVEGYCAPVIERGWWEAVQAMRRGRRSEVQHARRVRSRFLLSGLVYCGRCGSPLSGYSVQRAGQAPYDRYACSGMKMRKNCDLAMIPGKTLDLAVIRALREHVLRPDVVEGMYADELAWQAERAADAQGERGEIGARLGVVRRKIGHVSDAIAEAGMSRALRDKLQALEVEEGEMLARQSELERSVRGEAIQGPVETLARLQGWLVEDPQGLLREMVARVTVDREGDKVRGEIVYYYPLKKKSEL